MEGARIDVMDGVLRSDPVVGAANEPAIDGAGRPAGWAPFEVWRTRLRDVQDERARRDGSPARD